MSDELIPSELGGGSAVAADDLMAGAPPPVEALLAEDPLPPDPLEADPNAPKETPAGSELAPPVPAVESDPLDAEVAAIEGLRATNPDLADILTTALEARIADHEKPADAVVEPARAAALQVADLSMLVRNNDVAVQEIGREVQTRLSEYKRDHAAYTSAIESGTYEENDPLIQRHVARLHKDYADLVQADGYYKQQLGGVNLLKQIESEIRIYPPFAQHARLYAEMVVAGEIAPNDTFVVRESKLNAKLAPLGKAVGSKPKGAATKELVEKLKKIQGPKIGGARSGSPIPRTQPTRARDVLDELSDSIFGKKK